MHHCSVVSMPAALDLNKQTATAFYGTGRPDDANIASNLSWSMFPTMRDRQVKPQRCPSEEITSRVQPDLFPLPNEAPMEGVPDRSALLSFSSRAQRGEPVLRSSMTSVRTHQAPTPTQKTRETGLLDDLLHDPNISEHLAKGTPAVVGSGYMNKYGARHCESLLSCSAPAYTGP